MKPRILIIEDEPTIAENIRFALSTEGFDPIWRATGQEGLRCFQKGKFDLIILDIGLPDQSGFDLCKEIRGTDEIPIVFLTARDTELDRVLGLEIGADDYIVKPFSPRELTARVKTILRRVKNSARPALPSKTHFQTDEGTKSAQYQNKHLNLTKAEYLVLQALIAHPGQVLSRAQIMESISDTPSSSLERTIDAHIKSIRQKVKKINPKDVSIQTHRGFGYSLKAET